MISGRSLWTRVFRARLGDWRYRALLLAAMLWRRLLLHTTVVAITGSLGKTTAKEILAAILQERGPTVATTRTSNSVDAVARTILRTRPWHRFLILEVGTDRPGLIRRSAFISNPDIAVILTVARTHTNTFQTLEDTALEKASLLAGLRLNGTAILNQDDPRVAAMAAGLRRRVVRFGLSDRADIRAGDVSASWPRRLAITLATSDGSQRVQTQLVGEHWTSSLLGATAAALECGVPLSEIASSVAAVSPTPGRLDPRPHRSGAIVLRDDFNGSIDSFGPAMQVLRGAQAQRKILAISTLTDSSESWTQRLRHLATEAKEAVDTLVLLGGPSSTDRARRAVIASGIAPDRLRTFTSLSEAAEFFRLDLRDGDLLLLRGRANDHVERIFHAQTKDVRCWLESCRKMCLCDDCSELLGEPVRAGDFVPASRISPLPATRAKDSEGIGDEACARKATQARG